MTYTALDRSCEVGSCQFQVANPHSPMVCACAQIALESYRRVTFCEETSGPMSCDYLPFFPVEDKDVVEYRGWGCFANISICEDAEKQHKMVCERVEFHWDEKMISSQEESEKKNNNLYLGKLRSYTFELCLNTTKNCSNYDKFV